MRPDMVKEGDEDELSQVLIEAALRGDEALVEEALRNKATDVNYIGILDLRVKHTDSIQREDSPDELCVEYLEFKTHASPLFAAAHAGHTEVVKKLLAAGSDVNQKLFRGYATTAAAREGHEEVVRVLLKAGASQPACEEALLEACLSGQLKMAELLVSWEMARPEILTSALIHASSRGLVDIVELLIKNGVDVNSWHRVLLRSAKPVLHASVDCTALIAAVVSRQAPVVKYLLQVGADPYGEARLGAWSWDLSSSEAVRVGAGMAEPYNAAWCAIEYWEARGRVLGMLLKHVSANARQRGRSLLCHAIVCRNAEAVQMLLDNGADPEFRVCADDGSQLCPLHLAARQGFAPALKALLAAACGCDANARTGSGETALMISALCGHEECFRELLLAGADLGVVDRRGQGLEEAMDASPARLALHNLIWEAVMSGRSLRSSSSDSFSLLHFAARHGSTKVVRKILEAKDLDLNLADRSGCSAAMVAARCGSMEVFKVLLLAGASMSVRNRRGETALALAEGSGHKEWCERILSDALLRGILREDRGGGFEALHFAARRGDPELLAHLLKRGHHRVDAWNEEKSCTPLMLAVKGGHLEACKLLLSFGADCCLANARDESALSIARRCAASASASAAASGRAAEGLLLDHMAKRLVLAGADLLKHTREGKGKPHPKHVRMLKSGLLSWGQSKSRNELCIEASLGSSARFEKNQSSCYPNPSNAPGSGGVFHVKTHGKEIHFHASTDFAAELWVRGINLIIREAMGRSSC